MAHELGYAFRQRADELRQIPAAIAASEPESREPICRTAMMTPKRGAETAAHESHELVLPSDSARLKREIEGTPHPRDAKLLGNPGHGFEDGRKQVRVLMRIQVCRVQSDRKSVV